MYEKGKMDGVEIGKQMKISELKSILEIKDKILFMIVLFEVN